MTPTVYSYAKTNEELITKIDDSIGVKPVDVKVNPPQTVDVYTADALREDEKQNLDQFFIDRGYAFVSQVP